MTASGYDLLFIKTHMVALKQPPSSKKTKSSRVDIKCPKSCIWGEKKTADHIGQNFVKG